MGPVPGADDRTKKTIVAVGRFNEAFGRHDVDGVMRAMTDDCVFRWLYRWLGKDGTPGHIRGVDVFRVREGKVAEKLSYVKG